MLCVQSLLLLLLLLTLELLLLRIQSLLCKLLLLLLLLLRRRPELGKRRRRVQLPLRWRLLLELRALQLSGRARSGGRCGTSVHSHAGWAHPGHLEG